MLEACFQGWTDLPVLCDGHVEVGASETSNLEFMNE